MAAALVAEGRGEAPATFSLFVRSLRPTRGYLVAAGLQSAVGFLRDWAFDDGALARLRRAAPLDPAFLDWLRELHFTGGGRAVPPGRHLVAPEAPHEDHAPLPAAPLPGTNLPYPVPRSH